MTESPVYKPKVNDAVLVEVYSEPGCLEDFRIFRVGYVSPSGDAYRRLAFGRLKKLGVPNSFSLEYVGHFKRVLWWWRFVPLSGENNGKAAD